MQLDQVVSCHCKDRRLGASNACGNVWLDQIVSVRHKKELKLNTSNARVKCAARPNNQCLLQRTKLTPAYCSCVNSAPIHSYNHRVYARQCASFNESWTTACVWVAAETERCGSGAITTAKGRAPRFPSAKKVPRYNQWDNNARDVVAGARIAASTNSSVDNWLL